MSGPQKTDLHSDNWWKTLRACLVRRTLCMILPPRGYIKVCIHVYATHVAYFQKQSPIRHNSQITRGILFKTRRDLTVTKCTWAFPTLSEKMLNRCGVSTYIFLLITLQHSRLYCFKGPIKWWARIEVFREGICCHIYGHTVIAIYLHINIPLNGTLETI